MKVEGRHEGRQGRLVGLAEGPMGGPRGQWQVNEPCEGFPAICATRLLLGEEVVQQQLYAQKGARTRKTAR